MAARRVHERLDVGLRSRNWHLATARKLELREVMLHYLVGRNDLGFNLLGNLWRIRHSLGAATLNPLVPVIDLLRVRLVVYLFRAVAVRIFILSHVGKNAGVIGLGS